MSEHVILAENIHIGTNKAIFILFTCKANCMRSAQHITFTPQSTVCPIKALTACVLIHPKWPGQCFNRLSGNPVFMQDIAHILNKLSSFLNCHNSLLNQILCMSVGHPIFTLWSGVVLLEKWRKYLCLSTWHIRCHRCTRPCTMLAKCKLETSRDPCKIFLCSNFTVW